MLSQTTNLYITIAYMQAMPCVERYECLGTSCYHTNLYGDDTQQPQSTEHTEQPDFLILFRNPLGIIPKCTK